MAKAEFEIPEIEEYIEVPDVTPGTMAHSKPFVAKPEFQEPLNFPGELPEDWQEQAITAGNGDGIFQINSSTGEITIADNTNLDYETTTSYTLTLTVGDGVNTSLEETVDIDITPVNDPPTTSPVTLAPMDEDRKSVV